MQGQAPGTRWPPAPWSPHHLCMLGSRHSRASAGLEAPACCQDLVHLFSGTKPLGEAYSAGAQPNGQEWEVLAFIPV